MATIAEVRGLSPIFTTTAAVATDRTAYTFDLANHDPFEASYYMEGFNVTNGNWSPVYLGIGGNSLPFGIEVQQLTQDNMTGSYVYYSGSTDVRINGTVSTTIGEAAKIGYTYSAASGNANINNVGTWNAVDTVNFVSAGNQVMTAFRTADLRSYQIRELQRYDITSYAEGKGIIDELMIETLTMTAGTSGPRQGYETAVMGTLAPDNPFGFTINELSEQSNDITLICDGIQLQTIFENIEIDGVVLTMLAADTFTTGGGVSTWTFLNTTINLISTTVYPVKVQVGQ